MKKKVVAKKAASKSTTSCCSTGCMSRGCGGFAYFLGFLGALVYYIKTAPGFWMGVLGVLKAIVWPAFLVFELLKFLAM